MIKVIANGTLYEKPEMKTAHNGYPFVLAKFLVPSKRGNVFVSASVFDDHVFDDLLALEKGDLISVAGSAEISSFKNKDGQSKSIVFICAEQVSFSVSAKRKSKTAKTKRVKAKKALAEFQPQLEEETA